MSLILLMILGVTISNDAGVEGYYSDLRYTIADTVTRDTIIPNTELRSYWSLNFTYQHPGYQIQTDNNLQLSTAALADYLNFNFTKTLNSFLALTAVADGEIRYYHDYFSQLQDSILRNSYLNGKLNINLQYRFTEQIIINATDEIEHQHYLPADSFYYNYYLNRTKLTFNAPLGDFSTLLLECGFNRLWTPNQPRQNYTEYNVYLNWDSYLIQTWDLQLENFFSRRTYSDTTRSYLELNPSLFISRELGSALEVSFNENPRLTWFDETTAVYQNQITNQLGMEIEFRPNSVLTFRFGPQTELLRSFERITAQDYYEFALNLGIDLIHAPGLWCSVEDRLGTRHYLLNDSAFQSNYRFNEFNFYGSWKILNTASGELRLELMLNISPEWHQEAIDNLAALTSSIQLQYSW